MIAIGTPPNIGLKSTGYKLALTQSHHVCVADYGFCSLRKHRIGSATVFAQVTYGLMPGAFIAPCRFSFNLLTQQESSMRQWLVGLALVFGFVVSAEAAPVTELEADGTAVNNSAATAQTIPTSAFTLPVPSTVFDPPGFPTATLFGRGGGSDVDLYRISGPWHDTA